jgi:hypothetical protein
MTNMESSFKRPVVLCTDERNPKPPDALPSMEDRMLAADLFMLANIPKLFASSVVYTLKHTCCLTVFVSFCVPSLLLLDAAFYRPRPDECVLGMF